MVIFSLHLTSFYSFANSDQDLWSNRIECGSETKLLLGTGTVIIVRNKSFAEKIWRRTVVGENRPETNRKNYRCFLNHGFTEESLK
jgi:hypothetical protein